MRGRPITRDIAWGIPVPGEGDGGKRIYVWF
ncbi:MAG: class I tRNA ligase family protein, partial [Holophaga sp.]|nr:class I tRNA ligase family protein [Holophaga sp.]